MNFDQAFREVGRRQLRGGAKSMGADEIRFEGAPFGRPLVLTSRVRLRDPLESFYTSAAHRLRDSKVGEAGYFVDLKVNGECSDAELGAIRELAQEVDDRQVIARRV